MSSFKRYWAGGRGCDGVGVLTKSISSLSSDWRTMLVTTPAPGAARSTTSTLPKNMYLLETSVGGLAFLPDEEVGTRRLAQVHDLVAMLDTRIDLPEVLQFVDGEHPSEVEQARPSESGIRWAVSVTLEEQSEENIPCPMVGSHLENVCAIASGQVASRRPMNSRMVKRIATLGTRVARTVEDSGERRLLTC